MKSLLYYISIFIITFAVCSCSKKVNGDNKQMPSGQDQVSEPNNTVQNQPEQVAESKEIIQNTNFKIVPVPSQETLTLSPEDMVLILQAINFSDSQIQNYSYAIRDGLSKSGAVRILIDDKAEAGFAVQGEEILISSRYKGNLIFNIKTGWVGTQW